MSNASLRSRVVGLSLAIALLISACVISACGSSAKTGATAVAPPKPLVVVTTTQLADFANIIGGSNITLYPILKPNEDPHDYTPTADDITALSKADLIIKNGEGLEPWLDKTLAGADTRGILVDSSLGVTPRYRDSGRKQIDPHIWHSPINARIMVDNITRALATQDQKNASNYEGNERAYDSQLSGLENDNNTTLGSLTNRNLVTTHDVLGYYADEFKLSVVGTVIPGFDPIVVPTSAQLAALVGKMKTTNVKAVFAENGINAVATQGVATQAGVTLVQGPDALYGDSLGALGTDGDTYLKAEAHNTQEIANNLR